MPKVRVTLIGLRDTVVRVERELQAQARAYAQVTEHINAAYVARPSIERHEVQRAVAASTFELAADIEVHRKRIDGLNEVIKELLRRVTILEERSHAETSTYSTASVGPITSSFENVAGHLIFHETVPTRRARRRKKR